MPACLNRVSETYCGWQLEAEIRAETTASTPCFLAIDLQGVRKLK